MAGKDIDRVVEIAAGMDQAPHWPRWVYEAALDPDFPKRIARVAEDAATGVLAGFAVAGLTPPEAELETIVVAAEFQRCGIARRLFQTLADELRQEQVGNVLLEVRASNEPAQAFYRALGFAESGHRHGYYADPVEDAVLMRLGLS
jgi:[ribosomal protein S18]-alanine N-acetyltransferase